MVPVHQRGLHDCGVAVAAMIGQVSYEAVLDRLITGLSAHIALRNLVLWRALEDITQVDWHMEELRKPWPQVGSYPFPDATAAAAIRRQSGSGHYIAVCGGRVYDPLFDVPFSPTEYPDRSSWVVTVFRPKAGACPVRPTA